MGRELPRGRAKRGGVGWWMDEEGHWRSPGDWPGEDPPVDGWTLSETGKWAAPADESDLEGEREESSATTEGSRVSSSTSATTGSEAELSRQALSDIRAMLAVGTSILIAGAIAIGLLISQQGAEASAEATATTAPEVVFAAETEEVRAERRREAAESAPDIALERLAELPEVTEDADPGSVFDETLWLPHPTDCLDPSELVLIDRSEIPIGWADNLECVPATGLWHDPYVDVDIERTIDAQVQSLVPLEVVHSSGGHLWTPATRERFLTDVDHPATLVILSRGAGHNPRNQSPDEWRPSNEAEWCGYAIDWVAVKQRWELGVTVSERAALAEMLQTCSDSISDGPHLGSMLIDPVPIPLIERTDVD